MQDNICLRYKKSDFFGNLLQTIIAEKEAMISIVDGPANEIATRDVVIQDISLIIEHIERTYPYPSLLPVVPMDKAKYRLWTADIFGTLVPVLEEFDKAKPARKQEIKKTFIDLINRFEICLDNSSYIFGDDVSVLDLIVANLIVFYKKITIDVSKNRIRLISFMKKILNRDSIRIVYSK